MPLPAGQVPVDTSLLSSLVALAERGLNDLEQQLREDPASVSSEEIIEATEVVREAANLL